VALRADEELDRLMREKYVITYDEHRKRHGDLLEEITAKALRSPVYSGRITRVSALEDLSTLPLTSYESISECIERGGLDRTLLSPSEHNFRTSGSTGRPKSFHYGKEDVELFALEYAMVSRVMGIRPGMRGWNLGGPLPDVSGFMFAQAARVLEMGDVVSTFLKDDKDLIKALQRISSERNIDIMATAALILYLIGRMSREPGFLNGLIEEKAMRSYHLPRPLAKLARRIYLRGVDMGALRELTDNVTVAISYAEPLNPYMSELRKFYPRLKVYDAYGSTENPITAVQIDHSVNGLSMFINSIIPEIVSPEDVLRGKADPKRPVKGVPWPDWKKGMTGELVVTRPGQCLPLVRYPTGDIIEVLEPIHRFSFKLNGERVEIGLPLIRILGRAVETLDFEAQDEAGNYLGMKFYSRHVNEALHRSTNVRWWEMYNIKEMPARLSVVVIPQADVPDPGRFRNEIVRRLTEEKSDIPHSFQTANDLGKLEVIVLPAHAYKVIEAEIDRRIREGRSYGQLKPKHIYTMAGEEEFRKVMHEKYGEAPVS
jgi:phenylacetate-coenzyme A ligase PaaK-like adenylate-forming protein